MICCVCLPCLPCLPCAWCACQSGAFGTVYNVKHRRLGRMYAMKQLAQGLSGGELWASTPDKRRPRTGGGRPRTAARVEESQAAAEREGAVARWVGKSGDSAHGEYKCAVTLRNDGELALTFADHVTYFAKRSDEAGQDAGGSSEPTGARNHCQCYRLCSVQ